MKKSKRTSKTSKKNWKLNFPDLQSFAETGHRLPADSEILSFSHALTVQRDYGPTEDFAKINTAKVINQDISIVRMFDACSPVLMKAMISKHLFKRVLLSLEEPQSIIHYELNDVLITSFRPGGSVHITTEPRPLEEIGLFFASAKVTYSDAKHKSSACVELPK